MNPLQLSQILPQQSQNSNPSQVQKESSVSFADVLKEAQREKEEVNSKDTKTSDSSKINENQNIQSASIKETQENESEETAVNTEAENKIALKDSSVKEKEKVTEKVSKSVKNEADKKKINALEAGETSLTAQNLPANDDAQPAASKAVESENTVVIDVSKIQNKESKLPAPAEERLKIKNIQDVFVETDTASFKELTDAALDFIADDAEGAVPAVNDDFDAEKFLANAEALLENRVPSSETEVSNLNNAINIGKADSKNTAETKPSKGRAKIDVHDLRTSKSAPASEAKQLQKSALKKENGSAAIEKNISSQTVAVETAGRAEANITSSSAQSASSSSSTFQAMLTSSVQENAAEIVKAGNIILKDNDKGSINLILKPESLGSVKISLSLDGKLLSGQINVQSQEALEAFRESIDSLKQAFTESGFETGSFDLNFSQQGFAQGGNNGGDNPSSSFLAQKTYGDFVSSDGTSQEGQGYADESSKDYSVNIVA